MAGHDLQTLKTYLTAYMESITTRGRSKLYRCPLCANVNHKHDGTMSIYANGERCKCFSCGFGDGMGNGADIFDLCAAYEHVSLTEATKMIIERYGSAATAIPNSGKPSAAAAAKASPVTPADRVTEQPEPHHDYSEYIARCAAALPGSPAESYLADRGITRDTMRRFKLGYDPECYNKQLRRKVPSIVIPYNGAATYYATRTISEKAYDKPKSSEAGSEPPFNAGALYGESKTVFVVESQLCAISIEQAGGSAIAIGGSGGGKLISKLKQKPTAATLILCLDNDEPGRKALFGQDQSGRNGETVHTPGLADNLEALGVSCVDGTALIMGSETNPEAADYRKDPNEVLQKDGGEAFRAIIQDAITETEAAEAMAAQEAEAERQYRTGAGMVDSFLEVIQTHKYEPMPTGVRDIDKALGGGFFREQLILLGAAPGMGKTALAQWLLENMAAKDGVTVLFMNLEMSREQILARSLSRIAARNGYRITGIDVLKGYAWTDAQREAVLAAAEEYKRTVAPWMTYNPDGMKHDIDSILEYMESEAERAEKAGKAAPIVCVDYLQIITGKPGEDSAAIIKRALMGFKGFAVKHSTTVLLIMAHNREANRSGKVSMESGRDTSAIEYSADVQLALTYTRCVKSEENPDPESDVEKLTPEEKKNHTLRVVKGRFGGKDSFARLRFDGETMTYTQILPDLDRSTRYTSAAMKPGKQTIRF